MREVKTYVSEATTTVTPESLGADIVCEGVVDWINGVKETATQSPDGPTRKQQLNSVLAGKLRECQGAAQTQMAVDLLQQLERMTLPAKPNSNYSAEL